jgi:hypothetical protein
MESLISYLRGSNIDRVFIDLGLDFDRLFPPEKMGAGYTPYDGYEWIVKKVPRFNTIVNAVPPEDRLEELPWEEWYMYEHSTRHHVLYLQKPPRYDEIFEAPENDDVHPIRTLGKRWYVIDDRDMSPVLLR